MMADDPFDADDEWQDPPPCAAAARAHDAIRAGDATALAEVLAGRPDLARNFADGPQLVQEAAQAGDPSVLAVLLDAGFPVGVIDASGGTALMAAAWEGHAEAVRLLLAAGADPDVLVEEHCHGGDPEVVGLCALLFALAKGHHEAAELLEAATSPEVRALARRELPGYVASLERNRPPHEPTVRLYMACHEGRPDRLRQAIADGGLVDHLLPREACNRLYGGTPLCFAAGTGRSDLVEALLEAGADPGLAGHDGLTPARVAAMNGHAELAERLRASARRSASGADRTESV
jgi:ankyrin repeat protein